MTEVSSTDAPSPRDDSQHPPGSEYETGRVVCDQCGTAVSFRDEATNQFTTAHWDEHRRACRNDSRAVNSDDGNSENRGGSVSPTVSDIGQWRELPPLGRSSAAAGYAPSALHPSLVSRQPGGTGNLLPGRSPTPTPSTESGGAERRGEPRVADVQLNDKPPKKKQVRRAKRSEQERVRDFLDDPLVAKVEPYRALCKKCDKWIRLRSNSTYCSIPWEAHRTSCMNKDSRRRGRVPTRTATTATDRSIAPFTSAPLMKVERDIEEDQLHEDDSGNEESVFASRVSSSIRYHPYSRSAPSTSAGRPSGLDILSHENTASSSTEGRAQPPQSPHASQRHALTASPAPQTSRDGRLSVEERASELHADPAIREVEQHRVLCATCERWIQLRHGSTYSIVPWLQHRDRCLERQLRRNEGDRLSNSPPAMEADSDGERSALSPPRRSSLDAGVTESRSRVELASPIGRRDWVNHSVQYLFKTTHAAHQLTVPHLTQYLNASVPSGSRYSTFTAAEVVGILEALDYPVDRDGTILRIP